MGRFTKTFKHEMKFDGDDIVVELKRLTNKQMLKLAPFFREGDEGTKLSFADRLEVLSATAEILPECVVSISGLKSAEGIELKLDDILGELYFGPVIDAMIGSLLTHSTAQGVNVKKSEPPLPVSQAELVSVKDSASADQQ